MGITRPATDSTPRALTAFDSAKARALLRDRLPCLGCHTLGGEGGRIGPDLTTVRQRRAPTYIAAMIGDPQHVVPGTVMPKVAMPTGTRALITAFLAGGWGAPPEAQRTAAAPAPRNPRGAGSTIPTQSPRSAAARSAESTASAASTPATRSAPSAPATPDATYAKFCAPCHGAAGRGDGPNARYLPVPPANHASRDSMSVRTDDRLYDAIAAGGYPLDKSPRMPPFGETLSRDEIRALVVYIRRLCKCEGPAWGRTVTTERHAGGGVR